MKVRTFILALASLAALATTGLGSTSASALNTRSPITIPVTLLLSTAPVFVQSSDPAPAPPAAEASVHGYGDRNKTCTAWTDKCRNCMRGDDDRVHCSNIGIACQPAEITCRTRRPEPAK
jgi:hypothetical protein